jgi:hypothetical protein
MNKGTPKEPITTQAFQEKYRGIPVIKRWYKRGEDN